MKSDLWTAKGLGTYVMTNLLINSVMHITFVFLDIDLWIWLFKRDQVKKNLDKYTQQEANEIFEGPQPPLAQWYVDINLCLGMSLFFQPLTPMGIYLTAFACILQALTDKYLMTKIYSEPKVIGETLGNHMLANLTFFVFMFAS